LGICEVEASEGEKRMMIKVRIKEEMEKLKLKAEEINQMLKDIYDKDSTTENEKKALLEACGCVWASRMNKVVDIGSFMNMLYEFMGCQYDVEVKTTENETEFCVKTLYHVSKEQYYFIIGGYYTDKPIGYCTNIDDVHSEEPQATFVKCTKEEAEQYSDSDESILPTDWKERKRYSYDELH
jgi:hypothetical protein